MDANFEKFENEKNERFNAVLHKYSIKSTETSLKRHIIYFPGDIQNYETIMKNDEVTSIFSDFSFENTLELLSKHFDESHIWLILPSKYIYIRIVFLEHSNFYVLNAFKNNCKIKNFKTKFH